MSESEHPPRRTAIGRFAPGQSGNPRGRQAGSRHKTSLAVEQLLEGEAEGITRKAIEQALAGDRIALRLCLDRIAPLRRDRPVDFRLPPIESAEDAEKAGAALLRAVAADRLSGREAAPIMALLVAQKDLVVAGDHERRIIGIESKLHR